MFLSLIPIIGCAEASLSFDACRKAFNQGQLKEAENICQNQLLDSQHDKQSDKYLWSVLILSDISIYLANYQKAYQHLLSLNPLNLSDNFNYELLRRQGHYYRLIKNYSHALNYYQQAFTIAKKTRDQLKQAKSYNDIGLINSHQKNYAQALKNLIQSYNIKKQLLNEDLLLTTLNNIALVHYRTNQFEQALTYYQDTLKILSKKLKASPQSTTVNSRLLHLYSDLAATYSQLNQPAERNHYISQLKKGISQLHSKSIKMSRTINLVEVLLDMKNYMLAIDLLKEAESQYKNANFNNAKFFYQISTAEFYSGQIEKAYQYAQKSYKDAVHYNDKFVKTNILLLLSKIEEKRGNFEQSLFWQRQYSSLHTKETIEQNEIDFTSLKHIFELERTKGHLLNEKYLSALKSKNNYQLTMMLVVISAAMILIFVYGLYQKHLSIKDKKLLSLEIKKHQEILQLLQKPMINFNSIFQQHSETIIVINHAREIIFTNIEKNSGLSKNYQQLNQLGSEFDQLVASHYQKNNIYAQTLQIENATIKDLPHSRQMKIYPILFDEYYLIHLSNDCATTSMEKEVKAITQFEYCLSEDYPGDISMISHLIVDSMQLCLSVWKKLTASNKVEFAEQSNIWKVSIDQGRLRTRALDRYLSLNAIPKNPRILQVIKSCHFILSQENLASDDRKQLEYFLTQLKKYYAQL